MEEPIGQSSDGGKISSPITLSDAAEFNSDIPLRRRGTKNPSGARPLHSSALATARMTETTWEESVIRLAPLYRAALTGDWTVAESIFKQDLGAITSEITLLNETALHVAVGAGHNLGFVEKLVNLMCKRSQSQLLTQEDSYGNTALSVAAIVGNVKAAEILVEKNHGLLILKNSVNYSPLLLAAKFGHRDMILYLLSVNEDNTVFTGEAGARLLNLLITFDIFGAAVEVLDAAPLPMKNRDVENPPQISNNAVTAPFIKKVYDIKRMHVEPPCKLVRRLCEEAFNIGGEKCASLFSTSILSAARMGTLEVAMEILKIYPYAIWFRDSRECNIFQLAVLHRQEKIYNLIYQMTSHKHFAIAFLDKNDNNILHLAGELAPSDEISGSALQLQRELQWFKEVESLVQPSYRSMKNKDDKTPRMIFSERHEGLVRQGEKWMKITASSCTVVAALIATVAFTAIFTVPGGNNSDQGIPILIHSKCFMVFAAADALAMITSSASVMLFLGILTSRYAADDFLKALPTRLIIGLVSLFISISSMVVAFSASLYLVLVHQVKWVWVPMLVFAFIPIILFAILQFPLLVQMTSSTYGRSIFGLQSKVIIH